MHARRKFGSKKFIENKDFIAYKCLQRMDF